MFSDPRLGGTHTTRFTERGFSEGGYVNWGTMDIVGADGATQMSTGKLRRSG